MSQYRFIEAEKGRYPVTRLCRMAQVSRAAYYQWQDARGRGRGADGRDSRDPHRVARPVRRAARAG